MASLGLNSNIIGVLGSREGHFSGLEILKEDGLKINFDLIIITSLQDSMTRYDSLRSLYGKEKVLLPKVLSKVNLGKKS